MDPQVILDCNISGQSWLYDYENEQEAWLVYRGEPINLSR
jgi:hypothetical protein